MNKNITPVANEPVKKQETCRHYWIIESAHGPVSRGVCKICGAERQFHNSWPYFPATRPERQREREPAASAENA